MMTSPSIRQDRAALALRWQVDALKRELARAQGTAKPRQQHAVRAPSGKIEGLVIEALQAARTKTSIGVVSVGIEEQTAAIEALPIPPCFSEEERQALEETWKSPFFDFDKNARAALKRLVTDDRMPDLRKKLPEGAIGSAVYALGIFPLLRPPPSRNRAAQKKWEQKLQSWEQHCFKLWVKHPHPLMGYDLLTLARWACNLRDVLARWRHVSPRCDELFSRPPIFKDARYEADYEQHRAMYTMDAAIGLLHALYHGFLSEDEEHRSDLKRFPKVARWDHPQAYQRFFMTKWRCSAAIPVMMRWQS